MPEQGLVFAKTPAKPGVTPQANPSRQVVETLAKHLASHHPADLEIVYIDSAFVPVNLDGAFTLPSRTE